MTIVPVALLSLLPALFWLWKGLSTRSLRAVEALSLMALTLISLILASVTRELLSPLFPTGHSWVSQVLPALVLTALIEELFRFLSLLPFCIAPRSWPASRSLALLAGLSFASFETLAYVMLSPSRIVLRFFTALPIHVCAALCLALYLSSRQKGAPERTQFEKALLPLVILVHGFYELGLTATLIPISFIALAVCVRLGLYAWKGSIGEEEQQRW